MNISDTFNNKETWKQNILALIEEQLNTRFYILPAVVKTVSFDNTATVDIRPKLLQEKKHESEDFTYEAVSNVFVHLMLNAHHHIPVKVGDCGVVFCLDFDMSPTDALNKQPYAPKFKKNSLNNAWFLPMGQDPQFITKSNNVIIDGREGKLILKNTVTSLKEQMEELVNLVSELADTVDKVVSTELQITGPPLPGKIVQTPVSISLFQSKVRAFKVKIGTLLDA